MKFDEVWPDEWREYYITVKELSPIKLVMVRSVEKAEYNLSMLYSSHSSSVSKVETLMKLVRQTAVNTLKYNIMFKAGRLFHLKFVWQI